LGVTRQTLNNLVNGKSGISADMAIRLDKAFGGGAETWLRLQMAYDLARAADMKATSTSGQSSGASRRSPIFRLGQNQDVCREDAFVAK
jgi:plasmid maintenance system antidote protein VapI